MALPEGSTIGKNDTWLGDYIFADLNGDGVINNDDQTFIGNPEPKFTWGFGNTCSYKGFYLTIQFSGSYGNKLLNYGRRSLEVSGATSNLLTSVLDYARVEKIDPNGRNSRSMWMPLSARPSTMPFVVTTQWLLTVRNIPNSVLMQATRMFMV